MLSTTSKLTALLVLALRSTLFIDEQAAIEAYEDVRNDDSGITWAILKYEGRKLGSPLIGSDYNAMLRHFTDDDRVYGYVRIETGDEMSRRAKFAFITWIGPRVYALKKAKVSTDKFYVKEIWPQFGKEILADEKSEVQYDNIKRILERASGARYGTGQ